MAIGSCDPSKAISRAVAVTIKGKGFKDGVDWRSQVTSVSVGWQSMSHATKWT
jgi:hypothetical protein